MIYNLYSRRYKKENKGFPDIYQYEEFPIKLRIQLHHIFRREIGKKFFHRDEFHKVYKNIYKTICEEHGLITLNNQYIKYDEQYYENLMNFFIDKDDKKENFFIRLDILELFCYLINKIDIINEINQRILESGFGFQFENGILVRVDTKHTHKEIVKPALFLLQDKRFKNADNEYREAFKAFKSNDFEKLFVECNKAFESTMKIICDINQFEYKSSNTASKLINVLKDNDFIKTYSQEMLNGLCKVLASPSSLRNNEGGHGAGSKEKSHDIALVNFALHSTATNILFLMERQKSFEERL